MTLDIQKWMTAAIKLQQSISHNSTEFKILKRAKIPGNIKTILIENFGENFLNDADYIIFFKKTELDFTEKDITKLFKLTNDALGKGANMLNKSDFESFSDNEEGPYYRFLKITLKQ